MAFELGKRSTKILVEPEAFEGVARIAARIAEDIFAVTGVKPEVGADKNADQLILCATLGRSPLAEQLIARGVLQSLQSRREVYQLALAELEGKDALIICGSDKRGTIYGMFALSEYIGVSPLCFWGDAAPLHRDTVAINRDIETVSREPSVTYRGFFINDEWPCFGTWATSHFGGVNADCYERVFELLLRLKGNYLWPAMWDSSFPLDGPGSANEELADLYGVIMGYSHHEPCLRASEEWDKVRGEGSPYGKDWNFYTNESGLLRYWEDALKRSGKYENIITIGMRGERDSSMLGENATLEENISLLKRIITAQRERIQACTGGGSPQLLALYKEVERYFYGDDTTEGLKTWEALRDVIFLLCEDNFGHLRTVPPKDLRDHPGGWGMYYHLDYHGGPVSYEWLDSTPLSQIWEQMTEAWEQGIRELWIVNVGDLKLHEVPLGYFLQLAYDFDRWGKERSWQEYMALWTAQNFPEAENRPEIAAVFRDYVAMNSLRRPEALHAGVYHRCHYSESDRMLSLAQSIEDRSRAVMAALNPRERDAYYSMVHFSAMASANLVKMHLYAGKNQHYAAQGKPVANRYARLAEECIRRDLALAEEFGAFKGGKWNGMQLAPHIGFTKWNEDDSRYPVLCQVTPRNKPYMKVSRADGEQIAAKNYGAPAVISVEDFCYAGCREVILEIANGGVGTLTFAVTGDCIPDWLTVEPMEGVVEDQTELRIRCRRSRLTEDVQRCRLLISDGDTTVAVEVSGRAVRLLRENTFAEHMGCISILAEHYSRKTDVPGAGFCRIPEYGKYGSGMKVLPAGAEFPGETPKPTLTYSFLIEQPGDYRVELLAAPNNPPSIGRAVRLLVAAGGERRLLELLSSDFRAGENSDAKWCRDVLDQIHRVETVFHFEPGIRELEISAVDPGVVLEKIHIFRTLCPDSYLGPPETACRNADFIRVSLF